MPKVGSSSQYIEHYFCGNYQQFTAILVVNEGGGPYAIQINDAVYKFSDWLQALEDACNAHASLALTYTFTWDVDNHEVTLAATGSFDVTLGYDAELWLGFSAAAQTGTSTYTSDVAPHGFCPFSTSSRGIGYEPKRPRELVKRRAYRHGRVTNYVHHLGKERTVSLVLDTTTAERLVDQGPLFWSAMHVTHAAALGIGFFDFIPHTVERCEKFGDTEAFTQLFIRGIEPDSAPAFASGREADHDLSVVWTNPNLGAYCSALPYGHGINYAVKIEGIPTIFVETDPGLAQSNYTFDPSLIIDDAAQVGSIVQRHGSSAGIGRGFDLRFALTDSTEVRGLFVRPSAQTALTADLAFSGTTVTVADTTDFAATGTIHIGTEAMNYSAKTATTFTVTSGRQLYAPSYDHKADGAMPQVTDTPRRWKGRLVWLYALPISGFGNWHYSSSNALDDGCCIWLGRLATEPMRDNEGRWVLDARSTDRRLDESVIAPVTGEAVFKLNPDKRVIVDDNNARLHFHAFFYNASGSVTREFVVAPFSGSATGDKVWLSEVLANVRSGYNNFWSTVTPAAWEPTPDDLTWDEFDAGVSDVNGLVQRGLRSVMSFSSNSSTSTLVWMSVQWTGGVSSVLGASASGILDDRYQVELLGTGSVGRIYDLVYAYPGWDTLDVRIDDGAPSSFTSTGEIPSEGWIVIEAGGDPIWRRYRSIEVHEGDKNIVSVILRQSALSLPEEVTTADSVTVRFAYRDTGTVAELMLRQLQSSSTGTNGNYDTNGESWGYALRAIGSSLVDEDSFEDVFGGGEFTAFNGELALDKELSFTKLWAGLCAVSQRAVVPRRSISGIKVLMTAIHCGLADSGRYAWTVTPSELVVPAGGGDPIRPRRARDTPNIVTAHLHQVASQKTGTIVVRDRSSIVQKGPEEWTLDLYGVNRSQALGPVTWWSHGLFSTAQTAQVIEIDVVPWVDAQPGDQVWLNLPDAWQLWQWSTGAPGYVGPGRVLGDQFDLRTQVRTLTLAIDGILQTAPISPSAQISSWGGTASAPTSITISGPHYDVFRYYLTNAPSNEFDVVLYRPSEDVAAVATSSVTVDGVTGSLGSSTVLSVGSVTGTFTLTTDWYVTIPVLSEGTDEQDGYLHKGGGDYWV